MCTPGRLAAVPARQTQGVPQVGAKQIVDDLLRHAELAPSAKRSAQNSNVAVRAVA